MADRGRGFGYWAVLVLALVMAVFGLPIFAGGIWLITLGGSWYYALAGLGLVVSAFFLFRHSMAGVWIYLLTFLGTLIWALWEKGMDGWAQVPRLVGPTVILVLVLLCIPALRGPARVARGAFAAAAVGVLSLGASLMVLTTASDARLVAQETPAPAPAEPSPAEPAPAEPAPEEAEPAEPEPATPATPTEPADPAEADAAEPAAPADPAGAESEAASPDTGTAAPVDPTEGDAAPAETTLAAAQPEPQLEVGADWPAYGGSYHALRYSPLSQITRENIDQLERVWEYNTGDMPSEAAEGKYSPENTPLKVGNNLYLCSPMNILIAIDAASGLEEWRFDPEVSEDAIPYGATCRGVAYYQIPDAPADQACAARILVGTLDARLIAVDATTGQPCADFGVNGQVNLEEGIGDTVPGWYAVTSPPTIVRGIAVLGAQVKDGQAEDAPSGVVRGYDAVTGELAWAWDLGNPDNRGAPAEGEVYTRGTPNMWTIAAADEELGLVYLPLGNSSVDYYGSNRSELENEYATSLVAVDATTGDDVWHFQTVRNDVWDYDLGSQPSLVDFPTADGTVPALVLASKQGDIYILNRETGESLFPVEDRPVPTGGVEPEYLAETQPFSAYHTLAFPDLTEADMWGMTPIDQLWCRIQFRQSHYQGIYTPPTSDTHWLQYPGYNGGNDWGSVAIDVERGLLIANYNNMPNHNRLVPREEADEAGLVPIYDAGAGQGETALGEAGPQIGAPYAIDVNAGWRQWTGLLCTEPPYGGIRAIDLATGETVWDRPFGTARRNGPWGIPSMLPLDIGTPNNGGPVVTAGGLIFISATTDNLIHAIDVETGETVWTDELPGGGQTTPMTYEVDGRQYVVIAPGGHHFMETPISDAVIAYAVPQE
ncbi:membrane-bound PQQ-dependent dehydrogenase, glucose/quinate/shikimate family [Devosia albogilva]|uniref:Membrane-bound PQQ-dependent dehydrogenase, glucose/quinate/shikimate family n=1 Tax=Devosia albogilva TaxID=429726 RepID=A0ABW5QL51_9HYPH